MGEGVGVRGLADEATAFAGGWSARGAEGSAARQRRCAWSGGLMFNDSLK